MTIIRWSRFTVRRLMQGPVKYIFYKILRIVVYEVIFIKIKNKGFPNMAPCFPKYQGSLFKMLLFTASNSERAKKRMLRECQMSRLVQTTSPARVVASQLTHQSSPDPNFFKLFPWLFFCGYGGLFSDLQIDTNFCVSSTTYADINNLQTENTQNSSLTSKHKRLTIVHTRQSVTRAFNASLLLVATRWQLTIRGH